MELINQELQNKLNESKQENFQLKAKYELELQDYKNSLANLELKCSVLSKNCDFQVYKRNTR